jgi:hypothetical protein
MSVRRPILVMLVTAASLAGAAPVASAAIDPFATAVPAGVGNASTALGPCSTARGPEGLGSTGAVEPSACVGAGLSFIGPSIGQIATVIGPTIIGPAVIGTLIVSGGAAAGG